MKTFALGLVVLTAVGGVAHAAASPFAGHWKMDLTKSKFTGDIAVYTKTATGFQYSDGPETYAFSVDGKDYPTIPGRTIAWTKTGEGAWDILYKINGKVDIKAHSTLSPDGKRLSTTYVNYRPDGSTSTTRDVYERISGSGGLAGKWKDVKTETANDALIITTPAPDRFRIENPAYKEVFAGKTDGSPTTVTGPTIPPGAAAAYKAVGPDRWDYTLLLKTKVFEKGVMTVSPDGKVLTDAIWTPGKENEKSVRVFMKQ